MSQNKIEKKIKNPAAPFFEPLIPSITLFKVNKR
jgi:hypothetical protein